MNHKSLKLVLAVCLCAGMVSAGDATVVTGHHVLSAMASADQNCLVTYTGNLNPEFKGRDTVVELWSIDPANPGAGARVVGSTLFCNIDAQGCINTQDKCSGKFSFSVQATDTGSGCVLQPNATASTAYFFAAHVSQTYRSPTVCNANTAPTGPDPSGTAPCSGGCTP